MVTFCVLWRCFHKALILYSRLQSHKKRHFEIQILFIDGVLLVSNSCGFGEFLGKAPTKEVTSHIGSMKGGLGSPLCDGISFEIGATFIWHLYSSPHRVYNTRCMEGRLCKNWAPLGFPSFQELCIFCLACQVAKLKLSCTSFNISGSH